MFLALFTFILVGCGNDSDNQVDNTTSQSTENTQNSETEQEQESETEQEQESETEQEQESESEIVCEHAYSDATCLEPATCTKCGEVKGEAEGHAFAEATCTTPSTCSKCGVVEGEALGHDVQDADCTHESTCKRCGKKVGGALGHDYMAATCTKPATCSVCGATQGTALGHKYTEATCTAPAKCSVCGETKGSALGHKYTEATCTVASKCSVCGVVKGTALGHKYTEATCTAPAKCSVCGETKGTAAGHKYTEATCTKPATCSVCGVTTGTAKGHSWESATGTTSGACTICGAKELNSYGYNNLPKEAMKTLYGQLYSTCKAFANNKGTVAATDGKYIIGKISYGNSAVTVDEAIATWKVFTIENPQYYWLSNTVYVSGDVLELCIDGLYADGAYRVKCDTALATMVSDCSKVLTAGMKEVDKAMAIHDFIIGRMNYAYEADGQTPEDAIWAHNMMGCAEKKSGVCESYAKTYFYLCQRNGIDCIMVTGKLGDENHAWNLVKIEGQWYGVDCTSDDNGTDTVSYLSFGMNGTKMSENHKVDTPQGKGDAYLYPLPTLANHSIALVELYKNGNFVDTYLNIDAAFAAMTDRNGEYEVRLRHYDRVGSIMLSRDTVEYHVAATKTPVVKSIILRGNFIDLGNGYCTTTNLYVDHTLELQSNLQIYDLRITGAGTLDLKSKKMSLQGQLVTVFVPITGSLDSAAPSELHIGIPVGRGEVEFNDSVKVHTLSEKEENPTGVIFFDDTEIVKAKVRSMRISLSGDNLHIHEFCPTESAPHAIISIEYEGNVKIDKITSHLEYVMINHRFGKLEEYPTVTLGSSNTKVQFVLDGEIIYVATDMNGNEIGRYTESVNPENLTVPIATLLDKSVMNELEIYFVEWEENGGGTHVDHTDKYILNSKNQIVHK